jgi:hypothetical protein
MEYPLNRFVIEECSIAELLDDPIAILLMKSDHVDRQGVESLLLGRLHAFPRYGNGFPFRGAALQI